MPDGGRRGRVLRDVVDEQAGVGAIVVQVAGRILTGRALEHRDEVLAVGGDIHGLHALVIAPAAGLDRGVGGLADVDAIDLRGVTGQAGSLGELRDQRLDGRDLPEQTAVASDVEDGGAVFVGDVEAAVGGDGETLGVERQLAVGDGHAGEAAERRAGRVDGGGAVTVEVGDLRGALEGQGQLGLADGGGRVVGREREGELLDARGVVDQAGDVVTAVGQGVEHPRVGAVDVPAPGRRVDLEGREGTERVAERIEGAGGEVAHADEAFVEVGRAPEGDGLRRADGRRVEVRRGIGDRAGRQGEGGGGDEQGVSEVAHGANDVGRADQSAQARQSKQCASITTGPRRRCRGRHLLVTPAASG